MRRHLFTFALLVASLVACYPADLQTGYTFINGETNVNHTKLNSMVNGATILPSFITAKPSISTTPAASDLFLMYQASSGQLKQVSYSNAVPPQINTTIRQTVNQAAHGFSVGSVIAYTGAGYIAAKADSATTDAVVGVVDTVADANNFTFINTGLITGLSGLSAGSIYYLSDSSAGASTSTAPTVAGHFDCQVMIATSNTTAFVQVLIPVPAATGYLPTGTEIDYCGTTLPTGYLYCDGSAVSRTTYAQLFAVIGTTWGVGNGTTTFNVPDFRGRLAAGRDNMNGSAANRITTTFFGSSGQVVGQSGGSQSHTLVAGEVPNITMGFTFSAGGAGSVKQVTPSGTNNAAEASTDGGGGGAHAILPPLNIVEKIIKI